MTQQSVQRFYSLDALRGVAALSVVFWHWQHLIYTSPGVYAVQQQPWYGVLFLFYQRGWLAIDMFFSLSGFIFYWLYAEKIRHGVVPLRQFLILRLSRLYPLHLATLLAVALGQWLYASRHGSAFIYPWNDAYHFLLNLLFASSWGLEAGQSFNGPVWSVSVEMALYIVFFLVCRGAGVRLRWMAFAVVIGYIVELKLYLPLGRGVAAFFLGGLVYRLYTRLALQRQRKTIANALLLLMVLGWLFTLWVVGSGWGETLAAAVPLAGKLLFRMAPMLLFPLTILALAMTEHCRGTMGRRISVLGDISYASYLLHFPLQLAFAALLPALGLTPALFLSPASLVLFFALLIPLSALCHRHFELPMQQWLRRRFL